MERHSQQSIVGVFAECVISAILLSVALFLVASGRSPEDRAQQVSEAIKTKFESALFSLEPKIQRHFAVRMFRITGDEKYMYPIVFDLLVVVNELRSDVDHLDDSDYIAERTQQLLGEFNEKTRKGKLRSRLFEQRGTALFNLNLLSLVARVSDYRLTSPGPAILCRRGIEYLRQVDFRTLLLDPDLIRVYSPQAVNFVYQLYFLDIVDLRNAYEEAFLTVYPLAGDAKLTEKEFEDMTYGLTHFIIAASRYYQQTVDGAEFAWILQYFVDRFDRIVADSKPDVIAEVGICFLLAGFSDHPVRRGCQEAIIASFDEKHNMILSTAGSPDPAKGEHRNILAYMLLSWPDRLHPGPHLEEFDEYQELMPR